VRSASSCERYLGSGECVTETAGRSGPSWPSARAPPRRAGDSEPRRGCRRAAARDSMWRKRRSNFAFAAPPGPLPGRLSGVASNWQWRTAGRPAPRFTRLRLVRGQGLIHLAQLLEHLVPPPGAAPANQNPNTGPPGRPSLAARASAGSALGTSANALVSGACAQPPLRQRPARVLSTLSQLRL